MSSPRVVQSASWQSASWRIRELSSNLLDMSSSDIGCYYGDVLFTFVYSCVLWQVCKVHDIPWQHNDLCVYIALWHHVEFCTLISCSSLWSGSTGSSSALVHHSADVSQNGVTKTLIVFFCDEHFLLYNTIVKESVENGWLTSPKCNIVPDASYIHVCVTYFIFVEFCKPFFVSVLVKCCSYVFIWLL